MAKLFSGRDPSNSTSRRVIWSTDTRRRAGGQEQGAVHGHRVAWRLGAARRLPPARSLGYTPPAGSIPANASSELRTRSTGRC